MHDFNPNIPNNMANNANKVSQSAKQTTNNKYVIKWTPENKTIETYKTEPQAKKALKNYLIFHHATEARNEYRVEKNHIDR